MAEAYYFHSTLYAFSGKAVEAVIGNFLQTVNNVAVKCHYDRELDGFELTCPQSIGPDANEALYDALCKYVEDELNAAEREEVSNRTLERRAATDNCPKKRKPLIERFPESIVDDFDPPTSDDEDHGGEVDMTEDEMPSQSLPDHLTAASSFLHSVSDEATSSMLKLFNLRDTGPGMLERTIVHPGHRVQESVYRGFTCRSARWSPAECCYAFNGRSGAPVEEADQFVEVSLTSACTFVALSGESRQSDGPNQTVQESDAVAVKQWSFSGEQPTVTQFLEGMGTTELVDPETARDPSEVPSDALKYNAAPEHQVRVYGRSRVPAAVEPAFDEDYDVSDVEAESDSEDSESSTDDDASEKAPVLDKLRTTAAQPAPEANEHNPTVHAIDEQQGGAEASLPRASAMGFGSVAGTSTSQVNNPTTTVHATAMPEYDRKYAKVDKNGLTGNAGLQAQWEHTYPVLSPKKLNKHGISRRPPTHIQDLSPQPTSSNSTAMSLSTGPELQRGQQTPTPASSFSVTAPLTLLEDCSEVEPPEQPWASRMHSATVDTGSLIDVGVPRSRDTVGRVRPPPGFGQPFDASNATSFSSSTTVKAPKLGDEEDNSQDLIDLSCEETARTKPSTKLSWNAPALKPTVKLPMLTSMQVHEGDDCIVERLQDATNQSRPVRYTMRQRAGKKKTSNTKSAPAKPRVHLPMPDPPPPPKPKAAKTKSTREGAGTTDQAQETQRGPSGPAPVEKLVESHIEKLLRQVEPLHGRNDVELEVCFGMIMVRPRDDALCTGNWSSSALQRRLQAEETKGDLRTDFFERLTTSAADAAFMFDLLPGENLQPKVEYEITLRLLQGQTRILRFDQLDRGSFAVFCPEQLAVTLYMHYPIRVHDGRSRVIRSELALDVDSATVAAFVSSIDSLDDAPSFRALVPTKSFSVERVHIKRVFAKQIVPGVQLKVEETQDLKLDPVAGYKNFNLKATAASRPVMVDNHRLWYECSLHLTPLGGVQGGVLQSLVDKMVAEIDDVGYNNKGPYLKTEIEQEQEPEIKFW